MNPLVASVLSWLAVALLVLAVIVVVAVTGNIWPWTEGHDLHPI